MVNFIKEKRTELGLSQTELADRLKISMSHLNKIERGKRVPSMRLAVRIAKELDCTLSEIFFL